MKNFKMSRISIFNRSNGSLDLNNTCMIPQTIDSWALFSECYSYHFKKNVTKSLLEIVINILSIQNKIIY